MTKAKICTILHSDSIFLKIYSSSTVDAKRVIPVDKRAMAKSFQFDDIFFSDEAIVVLKRISNVNGKTNETKEVKQLTKKQIMNVVDQVELKFRVYCSKNPSKTVN